MRRAVRARGGARASSRVCGVNRLSALRPSSSIPTTCNCRLSLRPRLSHRLALMCSDAENRDRTSAYRAQKPRHGRPMAGVSFYTHAECSVRKIFLGFFVTGLYLKFRLYGIGYPATEKRFFVSVWMLGVIRTFETLKPMLVRSVGPFAACEKFG